LQLSTNVTVGGERRKGVTVPREGEMSRRVIYSNGTISKRRRVDALIISIMLEKGREKVRKRKGGMVLLHQRLVISRKKKKGKRSALVV